MRICFILVLLVAVGCRQQPSSPTEQPAKPTKAAAKRSTAQDVIDGVTGRTAVSQGRRAQNEIRRISSQERLDMEEVLGK